jgi:hypothetical protein
MIFRREKIPDPFFVPHPNMQGKVKLRPQWLCRPVIIIAWAAAIGEIL